MILREIKQWKRIEVLKDYRFYVICMTMLAMPWIATGTFVYQSFISTSKGWGPYIIAQSFMAYSIFSVITLFISGFLIDKFSSRKLLIYMNIPLLLATIILFYFDSFISSFIFCSKSTIIFCLAISSKSNFRRLFKFGSSR